jgi:predicted RNase H-like nuclease (RuvC/YqgF family)
MYRHIKNSCKKKDQELAKDQEHKEPVRLLKITIEQLNNEIKNQNERLEAHQNQINQLLNMSFHTNNHANVGQLQKDILEQINCVFNR